MLTAGALSTHNTRREFPRWRPAKPCRAAGLPRTIGILAVVLMTGCGGPKLMPTPNIYAGSTKDCFDDVPEPFRTNKVELVYVTDRNPVKNADGRLSYGTKRSLSLGYGICTVSIGKDLPWPELVNESRMASRRRDLDLECTEIREVGRLPNTPVPLVKIDGVVQDDPTALKETAAARDAFCSLITDRVALCPEKKDAYILVHGFANMFEDAAYVMAGVWHFLGRKGVPIIYTWPAGESYAYDRESGEFTVFHLKQFLRGLASCPTIEKIHIIAHSRGTDVVLTALRELNIEYRSKGLSGGKELKLAHVVLCAADLDLGVVSQRITAERIPLMPGNMTVYSSDTDRAIGFAEWLFKSDRRLGELRASDLTPHQRQGLANAAKLDIIQARTTDNLVGHDYFHSNPSVSSDLILMLRDGREPGAKNGRPLVEMFENFWEIRDGYPQNMKTGEVP